MKNKFAVLSLAIALSAPGAALWASAGDSGIQGSNSTPTGTPASPVKTPKKHHGHHHKKAPAPAAASAPAVK